MAYNFPSGVYKHKNLLSLFKRRYLTVKFDTKRLPEEGDSITVGNMVCEFRKKQNKK